MALKVKAFEVRHGDMETWCVDRFNCVKRPKNVKRFKRGEYEKAKDFAEKNKSKIEVVYTL
jgi:hypothetical protein